jgi:hypothetical protein
MNTIWKLVLSIDDEVTMNMPVGAVVLGAHDQHGQVCIWALVDPYAQLVPRTFLIRGTGHPVGRVGRFVGTVIMESGDLVWHIFEA